MSREITLSLPSDPSLLRYVHALIAEAAAAAGLSSDAAERLVLAVGELAANGMLHGNRGAPERLLKVSVALTAAALRVAVQDQGRGFSPRLQGDRPPSLLRTGGRGLVLVRACVDELRAERLPGEGFQVTVTKRLFPAGGEKGEEGQHGFAVE